MRNALAEVVGSSRSLSSYRIVTGGMLGTKTWADDGKTIGPRFTQMRDCEEKSVSVGSDVSIDESTSKFESNPQQRYRAGRPLR